MRGLRGAHGIVRSLILAALLVPGAPIVLADNGPQHQDRETRPLLLGVSGGNINHFERRFCFGGTLGALVTDGSRQFILSNNHILARTNAASLGEDIVQPALNDSGCRKITSDVVADLSAFEPIEFRKGRSTPSNVVDAALAEVRSGQVDEQGRILDIGTVSTQPATPKLGCQVKKSGRTTGLTEGAITGVDVTIDVDYGSGKVARFHNQIAIDKAGFSAGGDSGSLIVRGTSDPRPVGLLFAAGGTTTFANPIGAVLNEFGVDLVGTSAAGPDCPEPVLASQVAAARAAKSKHQEALLQNPHAVGVAVGRDGVVEVYLENGSDEARRPVPAQVDGVRVRAVVTGKIRAL